MTGWFMSAFKLALVLGLMVCGQVWAQADVVTLETVSAGQLDKVTAIFNQQQRNFGEKCQTVRVLKAKVLTIIDPVNVGAGGKPVSGVWNVRYNVDACGVLALRSVEMKAGTLGIAIEALAPGETLADAKLQADVVKSFRMAGNVAMPKCVDMPVIRDTRIRAYPATAKDRWQEMWIGGMCGRDLGQLVEFMPTKSGTAFKMNLPVATIK